MPLPIPDKPGQLFDNPDSYAMVFDSAWQRLAPSDGSTGVGAPGERKRRAMEACADHPFALSHPAMAEQVADFRIRLLGP
ncbi:MAG: hypothetical protein EB136_08970 [Synechococcaceae bacterium WBB_3_034]|jgi:hypothetical protein|nr:hypothetical protein [Synechococcaceae bacterium WBB_3_034]NDG24123.1 hypothetical protein [Synechococcaceae bacterium WBB_10_009]